MKGKRQRGRKETRRERVEGCLSLIAADRRTADYCISVFIEKERKMECDSQQICLRSDEMDQEL